jgi:low temperature requirement protein LtrA
MTGRDIDEAHRAATPLELLFDLTFVVAIAIAGAQLHHAVAANHLGQGLAGYLTTFAAVWWAWMTFTWFASAYDTDDATYRLCTMVQLVGVLILAAGVPKAAAGDFAIVTGGYVVMRVGLVALWWRAAREHPERRTTAMRYVWGILGVQALWVARLAFPHEWGPAWIYGSWALLMLAEMAVPVWAARAGHTPWHAHHIAERYGLFTIIVLGECVLGATHAVAGVVEVRGWSWDVIWVGVGSTALFLSLWWVYFLVPFGEALHHHRARAFGWGYGHFVVFGSLAALGAFLAVAAEQLKAQGAALGLAASGAANAPAPLAPTLVVGLVAAAVAIYLAAMWVLSTRVAGVESQAWVWAVAFALLAAVVAAVAAGLLLFWALPALALAPAFVIAMNERSRLLRHEAASAARRAMR